MWGDDLQEYYHLTTDSLPLERSHIRGLIRPLGRIDALNGLLNKAFILQL